MILTTAELPARCEHDYYATDAETVRQVWDKIDERRMFWPWPVILDPGAGGGVWGQEARQRYPEALIEGVELRATEHPQGYDLWATCNFLELWREWGRYDLIVGNPPYSHAEEFVRRSLELLRPKGEVWFLLRLAFLESKKRKTGLFHEFPPCEVFTLSRRPRFNQHRGTNATAFAVFRWVQGHEGATRLDWI